MRNRRFRKLLKIVPIGLAAVAVFGFAVMGLWNWLAPAVFAGHAITFWQALGLLILSRILLGSWHGGPDRGKHWRRRIIERWEQMTPEEREKFRQGWGERCGPGRMPPPAPSTAGQ